MAEENDLAIEDFPVMGDPNDDSTIEELESMEDETASDPEIEEDEQYIKDLETVKEEEENLPDEETSQQDEIKSIDNEEYDKVDLDDAFYASTEELFNNIDTAYLNSKTAYWEDNKEAFVEKYGDEAEEKFDEAYQKKDEAYQKALSEQQDKLILAHGMTNVLYDDDDFAEGIDSSVSAVRGSLTGSTVLDGIKTRDLISRRQGMVNSGRFIDDQGEIRKLEDDEAFLTWWDSDDEKDITFNDEYNSKDGRAIVGFEYGNDNYLHAIYDGDIPKGEILSVWDATDVLASNSLDSKWTELPKCVVRSGVNLAADAMLGLVELGNSINVLSGDKEDVDYTRTQASVLSRYKLSKSDYDNENMFTLSNGLDFVVNTYLQLILAAGLGSMAAKGASALATATGRMSALTKAAEAAHAAGKVRKAALLTKRAQNLVAVPSKAASLGVMSLMAGTGIKDEARKAGFSEEAIAGMYLAYLPAMAAASSTSGFLEDVSSMRANKNVINKALQESLSFTDDAAAKTSKGVLSWANKAAKNTIKAIRKHTGKEGVWDKGFKGYMHAGLNEGREEVIEQIYEEGLKQASSAISVIASDKEKAPRFKTVTDPGYLSDAMKEAAMNFVGGFMGGTFAKASFNNVPEGDLPFQGTDKDALLKIAAADKETQTLFLDTLEKSYKKGLLGSHDLLVDYDPKTKLHKKVSDLDEAEQKEALTLAKANKRAILYQFNKYKAYVGGLNGAIKDLEEHFPDLYKEFENNQTLHDVVKESYNDIASFYGTLGDSDPITVKNAVDSILDNVDATNSQLKKRKERAVEKPKTDEKVEKVAGTEEGVTEEAVEEESLPDTVMASQNAVDLATQANLTLSQAQDILNKEQKMRDIMSGKYIEQLLISEKMRKDPRYDILRGVDPDKLYARFGDDFVHSLNKSDVDALEIANKAIRAKAERMSNNDELIAKGIQDDEAFNSIKDQLNADGDVYLSRESLDTLNTQLEEYYAGKIASTEGTTEFFQQQFTGATFEDNDTMVDKMVDAVEYVDEEGDTEEIFLGSTFDEDEVDIYAKQNNITIGPGGDYDNHTQYIMALLMKNNEEMFKGYLNGLASTAFTEAVEAGGLTPALLKRTKVVTDYDALIAKVISTIDENSDKEATIDMVISSLPQIIATLDAEETSGLQSLDSYESPIKSILTESEETKQQLKDNAVTNIPTQYDNDTTAFFGNTFNVNENSVATSQKSIRESTKDLILSNLMNLTGAEVEEEDALDINNEELVFKGVKEAKDLLNQTETRIAQLELLQDMMNNLADFRVRNSLIMSDKDIRRLFDKTAYDNYSRYVGRYIIDPVKYQDLIKKDENNSLTEEEKEVFISMVRRLSGLYGSDIENGILGDLYESKEYLESLLHIGDSSKTSARLTRAYKTDVGKSAKVVADQFATVMESFPELLKVKEFPEVVKYFDSFDPDKASPESIANADAKIRQAANTLYAWGEQNTDLRDEILSELANFGYQLGKVNAKFTTDMTDLACFLTVPYDKFLSDYKSNLELVLTKNPDANVPTAIQQRVALHVYALGLKGFPKTASSVPASNQTIWVEGRYGTGKTTVAAGYGIGTLQKSYAELYPGHEGAMFCSNNAPQASKLAEIIDSDFDIKATKGPTNGGFTKNDLLDIINSEDAYDKLASTSFIVYDEATQIEFDSENEDSELMQILGGIEKINFERSQNNLPPIKIILMGDRAQGGYLEGMPTDTAPTADVTYPESGKAVNISNQVNALFRSPELEYSFRSSITQLKAVTDVFSKVADQAISSTPLRSKKEVNTGYGRIANDPDNHMGGLETVSSPSQLYTDDLATELESKLKSNPKFTAVIVDNALKGDLNNMMNPKVKQLLMDYPDRFTIHNTSSVQGKEVDYVIANFGDNFIPSMYDVNNSNRFTYNIASMVIGRATKYVKGYFGKSFKISSSEQKVMMLTKENDSAIKSEWKDFVLNNLLGETQSVEYTPSNEPTTSGKRVKPDHINFSQGEVVYKILNNKVRPIKYTVQTVTDDVVEFVDSDGNVHAFSYNTQEGEIEQFKRSKNGGRDLIGDVPAEVVDFAYTHLLVPGLRVVKSEGEAYSLLSVDPESKEVILEEEMSKQQIVVPLHEMQTKYNVEEFDNPSFDVMEAFEANTLPITTLEMRNNRLALESYQSGDYFKAKDNGKIYKLTKVVFGDDGWSLKAFETISTDDEVRVFTNPSELIRVDKPAPSKKKKKVEKAPKKKGMDGLPTVEGTIDTSVTPAVLDTLTFNIDGKDLSLSEIEARLKEIDKIIKKAAKGDSSISLAILKEKADLQDALDLFNGDDALNREQDNGTIIRQTLESLQESFDTQVGDARVDAKEYMRALEDQGIGVFYTNRENEFSTTELDSVYESSRKSYYAAVEMYGYSNVTDLEEIPNLVTTLKKQAMPMYETNKDLRMQSMSQFKYYFNTYEYNYKGEMKIGHGLFAVHNATKTPMLLGLIPSGSLASDSKIKEILKSQTDLLQEAARKYTSDGTVLEGVKLGKVQEIWKDTRKKLSNVRHQQKKTNLYIETPINSLSDVLSLFKQPTIGGLVTNSNKTLEQFTATLTAQGVDPSVNMFTTRNFTSADSLKTAVAGDKGKVTAATISNSNLFAAFGKDKYIVPIKTANGTYPAVAVKLTNESYMPFYKHPKYGFMPFFGIEKTDDSNDGILIEDADAIEDYFKKGEVLYNDELTAIKTILDGSFKTLAYTNNGVRGYKGISTKLSSDEMVKQFSDLIGYDAAIVNRRTLTGHKLFESVSERPLSKAVKSWANAQIPLSVFDDMMKSFGRNAAGLQMSPLMVFRSTDPQYRGKLFKLYTYNPKYDLSDSSTLELVKSKLSEALRTGNLNESLLSREGIGIVQVDSEFATFSDVYKYYKTGVAHDPFNKLIVPSKSQASMRMANMFIELLGMYDTTAVESNFTRIREYKHLVSPDGKLMSVLKTDKASKDALRRFLTTPSTDESFNTARGLLKTLVLKLSDNASLGGMMVRTDTSMTPVEFEAAGQVTGEVLLSKKTQQPIIFNRNPLTVFPKETFNSAIEQGLLNTSDVQKNDVVRFDLHSLFELVESMTTKQEDKQALMSLIDEIMQRYTKPGTINKGLNISPSVAGKVGVGELWSKVDTTTTDSYGRNILDRCTVRVKDIKQPNMLYDLDNLQSVLAKSTQESKVYKSGESLIDTVDTLLEAYSNKLSGILADPKALNVSSEINKAKKNMMNGLKAVMGDLHPKDFISRDMFTKAVEARTADAMSLLARKADIKGSDGAFKALDIVFSKTAQYNKQAMQKTLGNKYLANLDFDNAPKTVAPQGQDTSLGVLAALLGNNPAEELGYVVETVNDKDSEVAAEVVQAINDLYNHMNAAKVAQDKAYYDQIIQQAQAYGIDTQQLSSFNADMLLNNYTTIPSKAEFMKSYVYNMLNSTVTQQVKNQLSDHVFGEGDVFNFMTLVDDFAYFLRNNHNESIEESVAYQKLTDMGFEIEEGEIESINPILEERAAAGGIMFKGSSADQIIKQVYDSLNNVKSAPDLTKEQKIETLNQLKEMAMSNLPEEQRAKVVETIDSVIQEVTAPTKTLKDLLLSKFAGTLSPEGGQLFNSMSKDIEVLTTKEFHDGFVEMLGGNLDKTATSQFMRSQWKPFLQQIKADKGVATAKEYSSLFIKEITSQIDNTKGCNAKS